MRLTRRMYAEAHDLAAMRDVLVAGLKVSPTSGYVHPGDLDWWLRPDDVLEQIIMLWLDDAQIVGWSLFSDNYLTFDVFMIPELRGTQAHEDAFTWTEAAMIKRLRAVGKDTITQIWVWDDDPIMLGIMDRHGYHPSGETMLNMARSLEDAIPEPGLPEGFTVRHMEPADIPARVAAHRGAFSPSHMTEDVVRYVMNSGQYDPRADMIVTTPDGRVAAFALGWIEAETRIGKFEPVGTHPDFQRMGMGKAVMLGGLRQMQAVGMKTATLGVRTHNAAGIRLYESAGFRAMNRILTHEKAIVG